MGRPMSFPLRPFDQAPVQVIEAAKRVFTNLGPLSRPKASTGPPRAPSDFTAWLSEHGVSEHAAPPDG